MIKKLPFFLTLFLIPFVLTACTVSDLPVIGQFFKAPAQPVTLTYWGLWEDPKVMKILIDRYQEQNPNVTINYEDRSVMDLQTYKDRIVSGTGTSADIYRVHSSWIRAISPSLSPATSEVLSKEEFSQLFYPVMEKNLVLNNEVYGVPLFYDGLVLVYNRDHFSEIGQNNAPTSWEEFRVLAQDLSIREGNSLIRAGAAMGISSNISHASDIVGLLWAQAGVDFPSQLDSRAAADALDFYLNFYRQENVWDETFAESKIAFANEEVSMIFVPSWAILDILNANPKINLGVAPVPQADTSNPATYATYWVEAVSAQSPNKKAAWEFLKYLSSEESQKILYAENAKIRAFGSPYSSKNISADLLKDEFLGPVVNTANFAVVQNDLASMAGNNSITDLFSRAIDLILTKQLTTSETLTALKDSIR